MKIKKYLQALFDKVTGAKPAAASEVFGLSVIIEKKQDTAALPEIPSPYESAGSYYQVTVASSGENPEYPVSENVWSMPFVKLQSGKGDDKMFLETPELEAYPEAFRLKGFTLSRDKKDPSILTLSAHFREAAAPRFGLTSIVSFPEARAQQPGRRPERKNPAPKN
ncbi:MAG: hypothetical protein GC185_01970 [Alphaproteobacteria bacterium]|nr:hypothetical protein [Alphaproteobacteria bacterium]